MELTKSCFVKPFLKGLHFATLVRITVEIATKKKKKHIIERSQFDVYVLFDILLFTTL